MLGRRGNGKSEYEKCTHHLEDVFMEQLENIICSSGISKKRYYEMVPTIKSAFHNAQRIDEKIRYKRKEVLSVYNKNIGGLKKDFPFEILYKEEWENPKNIEVYSNDKFTNTALKKVMFYKIECIKKDVHILKEEFQDMRKFNEAFSFYKKTLDLDQTLQEFCSSKSKHQPEVTFTWVMRIDI